MRILAVTGLVAILVSSVPAPRASAFEQNQMAPSTPKPYSPGPPPPSPAARPAPVQGTPPPLTSLMPEFFVVSQGDKSTIVTIGTAQELQKNVASALGKRSPWILPQPDWMSTDLVQRCNSDPAALGGVILTYYSGWATHFYLLWQSETSTIDVSAAIISCNRTIPGGTPTIVGMIGPLPGAENTPWIVRRTQISIPLVTLAGIGVLFVPKSGSGGGSSSGSGSKSSSSTTTTDVTAAAIIGSIFSQASQRDIPGYSDPVRLRALSQHIGDDLITGMQDLCTTTGDVASAAALTPRTDLCTALGFQTRPPAAPPANPAVPTAPAP
jgi:hypothetical protein